MANMPDRSSPTGNVRVPSNVPGNKEPAEGSRETVMNSGRESSGSAVDSATEKAIARHARKERIRADHRDEGQNRR